MKRTKGKPKARRDHEQALADRVEQVARAPKHAPASTGDSGSVPLVVSGRLVRLTPGFEEAPPPPGTATDELPSQRPRGHIAETAGRAHGVKHLGKTNLQSHPALKSHDDAIWIGLVMASDTTRH